MLDAVRTQLKTGLKRFAPERVQAAGISRAVRDVAGAEEPWRVRSSVGGKAVDYRFFFICGFGKSGTNWLSSLLNLHPDVRCEGECFFNSFHEALDRFTGADHQIGSREPYKAVAEQSVHDLVRRVMLCMTRDKPGATVLGDRSPRPLRQLLPGAPTFWLVRDGRDVIVSYTYHYLRLRPQFNIVHWTPQIRQLFMPYAERFHSAPPESSYEAARDLLANEQWVAFVAEYWARRMTMDLDAAERWTDPLMQVRYEDLHANTPGELGRLFEFLGLDAGKADAVSPSTRTAAGFANENPADFYRKGAVGDWHNYDTPAFRSAFDTHAGEAAARSGYGDWTSAA
ncbi:MAG: sulfotransferase domain-containing protein [Planctomycetota bacterium]